MENVPEYNTKSSPLIFAAMAAIMAEINPIRKDKNAPAAAGGFAFRGIDDVYNALHGLFSKHGVFITTKIAQQLGEERGNMHFTTITLEICFYAQDGSSISTQAVGIGSDRLDKSAGKAQSQAIKHGLLETFLIPTKEMAETEKNQYNNYSNDTKEVLAKLPAPIGVLEAAKKCGNVAELAKIWKDNAKYQSCEVFKGIVVELNKTFKEQDKK